MDSRDKARDVKDSLTTMTLGPCLDDKLGNELDQYELDDLHHRIEDAIEEEVYATLEEKR